MNLRRWVGCGAGVGLLVATWHGIGSGVTPADRPVRAAATPGSAAVRSLVLQGAGSCAATACHGSMTPTGPYVSPSRVLRNEHTTWITQDRHANAYQVLLGPRSRSIAEKLSGGALPAHQDNRCLACHATTGTGMSAASTEVIRQDGVSCESCHGPAERWLGVHTQRGWTGLTAAEKQAQFGMRPTRELAQRAAICVECHVGSPGRDVNHDLIAAGHPRLNFEFAAYLANMPPHWVEDTRGNFPAQAWAIGQVATAKAALDLLHQRAEQAGSSRGARATPSPWPEFSEYDCFACHHDLADEAWRKERGGKGITPGTPPWGTWYYPLMLELARSDRRPEARDLESRFAPLRAEMDRFAPDPAKVAGQSRVLADALARWLQALPEETKRYDAPKLRALIETARTREAPAIPPGWDGAAQRYLALQPLRLSLKDLDPAWADAPLKAELQGLFEHLQFPRGYDSPRRFDPSTTIGER